MYFIKLSLKDTCNNYSEYFLGIASLIDMPDWVQVLLIFLIPFWMTVKEDSMQMQKKKWRYQQIGV